MKSNKDPIKRETTKMNSAKVKSRSSKVESEEPKPKTMKSDKKEEKQKKTSVEKTLKSSSSNKSGSKSNYEKRGTSTIYMPKSNALRNSISASKTVKTEAKNVKTEVKNSKIERGKTYTTKTKVKSDSKVESGLKLQKETKNTEIVVDYEDDFEDYESDFQECSVSEVSNMSDEESSELEPIEMQTKDKPQRKVVHSAVHRKVEEERRFDSGHYELAEARKRAQLETNVQSELKEEMEQNEDSLQYNISDEKQVENKSLPLSTDEGFEEDRSGDFIKSPSTFQVSLIETQKPTEESKTVQNRAKEIMSMIKLDTVNISLWECRPIPYEDFVKVFGKINARQIAVQTREDNLDCEIQTDEIESSNKWTQFPVVCTSSLDNVEDIIKFQLEQIGVGEDIENFSSENLVISPTYDVLRLNEFLNEAGKVILTLLERNKMGGNILQSDQLEMTFSEGFVNLSTDYLSFLSNRPVTKIEYFNNSNKILMTIHPPEKEKLQIDEDTDNYKNYCIGCVWNISEPSRPTKLFFSRSLITACCFHPMNYNIVFGGTLDGTINAWNLREDEMWHKNVTDKTNEIDCILRTPSYTTAGNLEIESHSAEIVAINILTKFDKNFSQNSGHKLIPIQICSMGSDGRLIIWSVINNLAKTTLDVNSSIWSEIKLNKSQEININLRGTLVAKDATYEFKHMKTDSVNCNYLYLATNTTNVIHASCLGTKVTPNIYKSNSLDFSSGSTCIETCPFEKSFFLVGCNDGTVRLHSANIEQSLLQLKVQNYSDPILSIQWSKSKPFSIYVLDEKSRIHIWDLGNSDILPLQTMNVTKKGDIKAMQLSPCNTVKDRTDQYLAIGTSTGRVEVHKLKREFYFSQIEHTHREIDAFSQYISIL